MSQTPTGTVAGYFEDQAEATQAVEALREAGFTNAHLGIAYRGDASSTPYESGHEAGEKTAGAWHKVRNFFEGGNARPATGENSLANREMPTSAELSDSPAYETSDFNESLNGLSVPEDRSRYLSHRFGGSDKGAVVTVTAAGREAEAESILREYGADLGDQAANYDYSATANQNTSGDTQNIQLLGEVLRVHKDRVSRGEVTFRKEVITEMQNVQVPVTREELVIERHAVSGNQPATGGIGESKEIRIPLTEERATVDKSTVVREEVSVGKREVEDVRDLSSDVRREELVVDDPTKTGENRKDESRIDESRIDRNKVA